MKIALLQMNVIQGDTEHNQQQAEEMITEAANAGAELVVLPEMWKSGYDFGHLSKHMESIDGSSANFLAKQARAHGIYLVGGSFTMQNQEKVYNTSLTFDPQGKLINQYSKLHLIGLMQEDKYLSAGQNYQTFSIGDALASVIICYDLRFPELIRTYAVEGASILFVPAQWPIQREAHWLALLRARAIENQMYVVGTNVVGKNENDTFNGRSIIFDPWGDVVAEAGDVKQILYGEIDLEQVPKIRRDIPVFHDRVPHLYRVGKYS
jgi:predicted amidohydrolase